MKKNFCLVYVGYGFKIVDFIDNENKYKFQIGNNNKFKFIVNQLVFQYNFIVDSIFYKIKRDYFCCFVKKKFFFLEDCLYLEIRLNVKM